MTIDPDDEIVFDNAPIDPEANRDTMPPTVSISEPPDSSDGVSSHEFPAAPRVPTTRSANAGDRPNPNSWSDVQLNTIVEGMRELKAARLAFDAEALLNKCVDRIEKVVQSNMTLILGQLETERARTTANTLELTTLRKEVTRLTSRVDALEKQLAITHPPDSGPDGTTAQA